MEHFNMNISKGVMALALLVTGAHADAAKYYISPSGNDAYTENTKRKPWATLGRVQQVVQPGDVVCILPGTYVVGEEEISRDEASDPYKIVYDFSKNGSQGSPISYIGELDDDGNRPVFDFSGIQPEGYRVTGFQVSADFLIVKNIEVVGLWTGENIRVTDGNYNTFENIACHDGWGNGFYLTNHSRHNLFVNCDVYNNYDPISNDGKGSDNEAFRCHVQEDSPLNTFIGCRAWNNADDGFDMTDSYSPVTCCYSIAYRNGYDADNKSRGEGNGFKVGGYGMSTEVTIPATGVPKHEIYHCIAASNKANGIYSNNHLGGLWLHDNTAYRNNGYNYNMVNRRGPALADAVDVNGYGHQLERNLSMLSDGKYNHVSNLRGDEGDNTIEDNSFTWVSKNSGGWAYTPYGNSIFESTTVANLIVARDQDGMLSETTQAVLRPKNVLGLGCSFENYQSAIADYRKVSGAEVDGTTGVDELRRDKPTAHDTYYNLAGQRVLQPTKGLYIVNGKKVIIK